MEENENKIISFYDQFSEKQEKTGTNSRHPNILDKVKAAGLKPHHQILEVGCGIGTVNHLLAAQVKQGTLTLPYLICQASTKKAKRMDFFCFS